MIQSSSTEKKRGKVAAEPGIAPSQRVKEFPNECFSVTLGKYCFVNHAEQ